jgi:phosphoribosylformylglycinamidine synthase
VRLLRAGVEEPALSVVEGTPLLRNSVVNARPSGIPRYNGPSLMKAYVYVSLKKSVLDPQGKTIHGALKKMGYRGVNDLRQGKYFEIALDDAIAREDAQAEIERIAREVLTNPVIEEYRYTLED